jgi:Xaa-Pro aminopeptidase
VAWLLNIRGSDVDRTPVALSFVIAHADGTADWFIAPEKVTPEVAAHLGNAVRLPARWLYRCADGAGGQAVAVDPERAVSAIFATLKQAEAVVSEARPLRAAQGHQEPGRTGRPPRGSGPRRRRGRPLPALAFGEGPKGEVTELSAAEALHQFRRDCGDLRDLSFDTISGAGPNGAIVHYRVSEETNRKLDPPASIWSIWRAVSRWHHRHHPHRLDRPRRSRREEKDRFTRVLKGHIALARAIFPRGTAGSQLDTLARQHLWQAGVDYAHGTGHGVGSFLAVHEGPQRIAKSAGGQAGTGQELLPGMFLSNEPGYYKTGAYGIRIENLVLVEQRDIPGAEGDYFGFETLTHVPIGRELVEPALLDGPETAWWNAYHASVWAILSPQLEGCSGLAEGSVRAFVRLAARQCSLIVLAIQRVVQRGEDHDRLRYGGHQRSARIGAVL